MKPIPTLLFAVLLLLGGPLAAAGPAWTDLEGRPVPCGNARDGGGQITGVAEPRLNILRTGQATSRGTVLVLPGGGYGILAAAHEGDHTAAFLNGCGFDAVVLEYHIAAGPGTRDLALADALAAWRHHLHQDLDRLRRPRPVAAAQARRARLRHPGEAGQGGAGLAGPARRLPRRTGRPGRRPKLKEVHTHAFDLILLGDSITEGLELPEFREVWNTYFVPRRTLDLGTSGARTENLLWSLEHGVLADNRNIFYCDVNAVFLNPDGSINQALMPDCLHPNPEGARHWAQALEPLLSRLMGEGDRPRASKS